MSNEAYMKMINKAEESGRIPNGTRILLWGAESNLIHAIDKIMPIRMNAEVSRMNSWHVCKTESREFAMRNYGGFSSGAQVVKLLLPKVDGVILLLDTRRDDFEFAAKAYIRDICKHFPVETLRQHLIVFVDHGNEADAETKEILKEYVRQALDAQGFDGSLPIGFCNSDLAMENPDSKQAGYIVQLLELMDKNISENVRKVRVKTKNAFKLVDNGGKYFNPTGSLFSIDMMKAGECDITLMKDGKTANATSGMAVAALCIEDGDEITFIIRGSREEKWARFVVDSCEKLGICDQTSKLDVEYTYEIDGNLEFMDMETFESISVNPKELYYRPESLRECSDYTLYILENKVRYIFDNND